jgi:hypothetical protein
MDDISSESLLELLHRICIIAYDDLTPTVVLIASCAISIVSEGYTTTFDIPDPYE